MNTYNIQHIYVWSYQRINSNQNFLNVPEFTVLSKPKKNHGPVKVRQRRIWELEHGKKVVGIHYSIWS